MKSEKKAEDSMTGQPYLNGSANMYEMIDKRKSCRSFTGQPVEKEMLEKIKALPLKPLYADIKVHWEITPRQQVKCVLPWITPQLITVYSEKKDGYLENAGFLFQQIDLLLQGMGLGVCWLGMGKLDSQSAPHYEGMEFVIMLAFGYPKDETLRTDAGEFKRKPLAEISDREDPRLEPARLAPSSVNSQPWYFTHEADKLHVYCSRKGILRALGEMNQIDIGIALAHLYAANPHTFCFTKEQKAKQLAGYTYKGTVNL